MEGESKKKFNLTTLVKYVDPACCVLLAILLSLVCTQRNFDWSTPYALPLFIVLVVCCGLMLASSILKCFIDKSFKVRLTIHVFDSVFLFVICLITGNSYLSALYCIILTQFYMSAEEFKPKLTLFIISSILYIVSFAGGYLVNNFGADLYKIIIDVVSGCVSGLIIMVAHFIIALFLLSYYANNLKLEKALKEAQERQEQLTLAYEKLSETAVYEERNRIARDIHDNAGHSMTAVIMQTEAAKLLIDSDPEQAKAKIISANIQAKNALEQMRDSVHLLAGRGGALSIKGALEDIIAQTIDSTDVKVRYDLDEIELDDDRYRFVCNCAKECLANGIRHGGATAFYVELKEQDGAITFIISDNGKGVDELVEGYGLKGIRAKSEQFGGSVSFAGESGEGFEVAITLPIGKENKDD